MILLKIKSYLIVHPQWIKCSKNLDKMLSKNADLNMAIMLFLVAYLAFDIKEFVPSALNNEIVRVIVIAVAVYLLTG